MNKLQTPARKTLSVAALGFRAVLWTLVASLGTVAMGQEVMDQDVDEETLPDAAQGEDVPYRIARLSFSQGGVSLQPVGETEWTEAPLNRPVVPGDYLRTDSSGRAELQMDAATVRLGSGSNFTILNLDDRAYRMRLTAGVINIRVRDIGESDTIEIETPQATASILRPGNYRLEVSAAGDATVVKVSNGMLEARGSGNQSYVVRPQQVATLTGTNYLSFRTATLGAPDSFDEWSLQRDQEEDRALSAESSRYVSSDTVGYEELEEYGDWRDDPQYGYVWMPTRVVSGWSPYRFGRYTYVSGWGWTWIDDAPWGFAPFHYGSWVTIGGRWSWVPGPRHRPIGGRPDRPPSHDWHTPTTPPRGVISRNVPRNPNRGDRDGFVSRDVDRGTGGVIRPGQPTMRDGERASNSRFRTRPDNNVYRYDRPAVAPTDTGQSGVPPNVTQGSGSGIPAVTGRPGEDRRMRIPRHEIPQNTSPRNEPRERSYGGRGPSMTPSQPRVEQPRRETQRPEASRPAPPPQQQTAPPADNGSRSSMGRGNGGAREPRSRER